jgi:hypothetical protein
MSIEIWGLGAGAEVTGHKKRRTPAIGEALHEESSILCVSVTSVAKIGFAEMIDRIEPVPLVED